LVVLLFIRSEVDVTVAPIRNPQFVMLSDGSIRNAYDLRIRNMQNEERVYHLSLRADGILQIELEGTRGLTVTIPPESTYQQRVYVTARPQDAAADADRTPFRFWVEDQDAEIRTFQDTTFHGRGIE
ncbi:MAG: FixG Ig-like domain-containing protein, partial [Pseudomonadota bacterium]